MTCRPRPHKVKSRPQEMPINPFDMKCSLDRMKEELKDRAKGALGAIVPTPVKKIKQVMQKVQDVRDIVHRGEAVVRDLGQVLTY
jgi:hypothetical protein